MAQLLSYLTYAELAANVNASDGDYLWQILRDVVTERSALQTWVEDKVLRPAHSLVNGYLSRVRSVPVASSSQYYEMVQNLVLAIAWYEVEKRGMGNDVREKLIRDYEDSIRTLRDISAGRMPMNDDDGEGPDTTEGVNLTFVGDDSEFDEDNFGTYF